MTLFTTFERDILAAADMVPLERARVPYHDGSVALVLIGRDWQRATFGFAVVRPDGGLRVHVGCPSKSTALAAALSAIGPAVRAA